MDQLRRIVRALRSSHRAAAHLNLTGAQLYVINVIGEANRPLSVNEVAQRTETDQSTVSVVTNRRVELSLTASGRTLQKKAPVTLAQQRLTATLQELSSPDSDQLLRLLTKIVAGMQIGEERPGMLFDEPSPGVPSTPVRRSRSAGARTAKKR